MTCKTYCTTPKANIRREPSADTNQFGPWEKVVGKFIIKRGEKGEYRVPGWE